MSLAIPFAVSVFVLFFVVYLSWLILKKEKGPEQVQKLSGYIYKGALTFLNQEYRIISVFVVVITLAIYFIPGLDSRMAVAFIAGALFSALAGNIGMRIATQANGRSAWAAKDDLRGALKIAFSSGTVMGLSVVGLGLLGITILYYIFGEPQIIYGFGFGASAIALFSRVGGGIYTKSADVGADLVGKVEQDIPEDDPRNPAVVADNVGDNVGDVAGMGADLFESYVDALIAAMVLGVGVSGLFSAGAFESLGLETEQSIAVFLPLLLASIGLLASVIGYLIVNFFGGRNIQGALNRGVFGAAILAAVGAWYVCGPLLGAIFLFYSFAVGLAAGVVIGLVTEYYTSADYSPTKKIARSSQTGPALNIIQGLSTGMISTLLPLVSVAVAIYLSYLWADLYGVAIAAVGMLSTLGMTLATDSYGPVADNAAGISEMAGLGSEARKRSEALDAVGNTTAAIGKGFAIGSAALTALVLTVSFTQAAGISNLNLVEPQVVVGLLVGVLTPFLFCALTLEAVGKGGFKIVEEVRRQFKEISGLMEKDAEPDYEKCVKISTDSALKLMIAPSLLAVAAPVVIGFTLGPRALGGFLMGAVSCGFLLAVVMANSGGAWDNAKKYIEEGNYGGKGSDSHKASVIGDTVGDPFKDTSGPSLNILIKLMSIVALIIAPIL